MRIYDPRRIRDAMRGEYEAGDLFDPRINKEASIDELYPAMGRGYAGGTAYRPAERNYAVENTDHYDSRGSVTPSYTDAVPDHLPSMDYSTLSHASRIEQQAAQEIADAIAEVSRPRDTEVLISDSLQDNLQDTQDQVSQMAQDTERYDFLFFGPPGTGKTMLARHIGRIVGLPVVEFRISALMRSWLGETERLFDRAFSALEAMAPNIVFIDEIEKAFGASSEQDGGTMMRCTGNLLSWLSDNPNPNMIVGTANNPSRMGEIGHTLTRSERFDAIFFIDVPNLPSRQKMLERWIGGADMASEIAGMTEKFSRADLRSVVKQAQARAEHSGEELTIEMLRSEVESKRHSVIAIYDQFQDLRRFGRMHCLPAGACDN